MQPLEILLIGDADCLEFREARRQMEAAAEVNAFDGVAAAVEHLKSSARPPELTVVAQRFPAEFSAAKLNALQSAAPLSRVVMLLGSWSEGESRTGDPWPGAIRVYWYRWPAFFADELSRMGAGGRPSWSLPLTASDEERTLLAAAENFSKKTGLIAVAAADTQTASWLVDACFARGYATVWLTPRRPPLVTGVDAVVCDLWLLNEKEISRLAALAQFWAPAPIVALLNNPRVDERKQVLASGASEVVAKPFELADLYWAIDQAIDGSGADSPSSAPVTWQRRISRRQAAS